MRVPVLLLGLLIVTAYVGLFGQYAFDDSYVGYSVAESVFTGHGFSFNATDRVVSTSAPLAVPLYILLQALLRISTVQAAQILSALALAIIGLGSYGLLRRIAPPPGAFFGAAIAISSPFTLVLWSHESLLYLAAAIVGLELYARNNRIAAALTFGAATLLRGEGLFVIGFVVAYDWRCNGFSAALKFAGLALLPFAVWAAAASAMFGGFLSETIAAKRAELRYETILPYLYGVQDYALRMYALSPIAFWYDLLEGLVLLCVAASLACGLFEKRAAWVFAWSIAVTALYAVLQLPFYFWFCTQIAAALCILAASAWRAPARLARVAWLARGSSACIALLNVAFLVQFSVWPGSKFSHYDWIIMPKLRDNAYRSLGEWLKTHSQPGETIAYAEFGQLHYYSGRDIVDYLGLVTSGAAAHLRAGDGIWTFKKYHPNWFIETPTWHYFVNPLEYDWFRASYRPVTRLVYPLDPERSRFTLYRMRSDARIPPPDERTADVRVRWLGERNGIETFDAAPAAAINALEVRTWHPLTCNRARITLFDRAHAVASHVSSLRGAPAISRLTLNLTKSLTPGTYSVAVTGCRGLTLAPPALLRAGFVFWGYPPPAYGSATDALVFYRSSTP